MYSFINYVYVQKKDFVFYSNQQTQGHKHQLNDLNIKHGDNVKEIQCVYSDTFSNKDLEVWNSGYFFLSLLLASSFVSLGPPKFV